MLDKNQCDLELGMDFSDKTYKAKFKEWIQLTSLKLKMSSL